MNIVVIFLSTIIRRKYPRDGIKNLNRAKQLTVPFLI